MRPACRCLGALVVVALVVPSAAQAQVAADLQLEIARHLLPEEGRAAVEFVLPGDEGDVVYRAGDGDWICRGDPPGDDRLSLSCYTRSAGPFLDRQRELLQRGVRGQAMREVIDREVAAGELELADYSLEINASGDLGPDRDPPQRMTVYYLLFIPFATTASIGVSDVRPDDPTVPYLHHPGTHEAHVMWAGEVTLPELSR